MLRRPAPELRVAAQYQPVFRELGIDAETVFTHPLIKPWRTLDGRDNCVLDTTLVNGQRVRWHVKRYNPARGTSTADDEFKGHQLLLNAAVPTYNLIAAGNLPDRRSFIIIEDLAGYRAGDKLVESGTPFDYLLNATADLAAKLHASGLHHRDLYLCHFFAKPQAAGVDVRLIDTARVKKLPGVLTRTRWIVKDLAQFWYSTTKLAVTDEQRGRWLDRYATQRKLDSTDSLLAKIKRKVEWIAKHDATLRRQQPKRNISIPVHHFD